MRPAARIVFAIAALALLIVVVASLLVRERASDTSESSAAAAPSRSVAASAPSDASRVAKAEPSATASLPAANAELQLLSIGDLRPAARSRWRIANAESPAREVRASDDGRLDVPSGMWSFESADAEWRAVDAVAEAKEGSTEIVWVSRIGTRAFRCVDVDGRPVEGVTALWFPREGLPQSDTMPPDVPSCATAKSDASGLVSLSGCPADSGTAVFLDPRFEREIRSFSGSVGKTVDVTMHPTSGGRVLRFRSAVRDSPVPDVSLVAEPGYVVARSGPGSNEVRVPPWVRADEGIEALSPSTFPCGFVLSNLERDTVPLFPRRRLAIRLVDEAGFRDAVVLSFETPNASGPVGAMLRPVGATAGTTVEIDLPAGLPISVLAQSELGASGQAALPAVDLSKSVDLVLRVLAKTIVVRDESGAPIPTAYARPLGMKFTADAGGRIRVPLALRTTTFPVRADGYDSVILRRRDSPHDTEADRLLDVTMRRAARSRLRVVSPAGVGLSGMVVTVWPERKATKDPGLDAHGWYVDTWSAQSSQSITNAEGHCSVAATVGPHEVVVDAPSILGTGEFRKTLYTSVRAEATLDPDREAVLQAPVPRCADVQVVDAATNGPVRRFVMHAPNEIPLSVPGDRWQGWISSDLGEVLVEVPQLGTARAKLDFPDPDGVVRVRVGESARVVVRVEGLPSGEPIDVYAQTMRKTPEATYGESTIEIHLDGSSRTGWVPLARVEGLELLLHEVRVAGSRYRFEPEIQHVDPERELVFRAVPIE